MGIHDMNTQPDASRWKVLAGSSTGTSHQRTGGVCQDYCQFTLACTADATAIVLVCADGAGSSSRAETGARLACAEVLSAISSSLDAGLQVSTITKDAAIGWYERARRRLSLEACVEGLELREYACTLLVAVVGDSDAAFIQLGDGAIVFRGSDGYQTAFWPQSGEYANTTNFLTGPDFAQHLSARVINLGLDEIALFTDGLQPLALHYATRAVHKPFFDPKFASLRNEPDPDRLQDPLKQFLGSKPVTDRTDDDTTLILATRCSHAHDSV
jgi:hypothetical protein